jgi:hypothetical protein
VRVVRVVNDAPESADSFHRKISLHFVIETANAFNSFSQTTPCHMLRLPTRARSVSFCRQTQHVIMHSRTHTRAPRRLCAQTPVHQSEACRSASKRATQQRQLRAQALCAMRCFTAHAVKAYLFHAHLSIQPRCILRQLCAPNA